MLSCRRDGRVLPFNIHEFRIEPVCELTAVSALHSLSPYDRRILTLRRLARTCGRRESREYVDDRVRTLVRSKSWHLHLSLSHIRVLDLTSGSDFDLLV